MIAMHKQNYKTQLPCWNTLETSLKHLRNTSPKTPWQHIKTPFKLPGRTIDTLLTHLKQPWNLLGILLKHHCNYLKTFLKYPWNIHEEPMNYFSNNLEAHINHSWHLHEAIFETSLELPWNSIETSLKHLKHPLNYLEILASSTPTSTTTSTSSREHSKIMWSFFGLSWPPPLPPKRLHNVWMTFDANLSIYIWYSLLSSVK